MELDIILFLAGSALAVAALGIIVYKGVPSRSILLAEPPPKVVSSPPVVKVEPEPEPQPIAEAPPPFSDDDGFSTSTKTTIPTDSTALSAASPFLVVSVPKSIQKARRSTRKRRTPKIDGLASVNGSAGSAPQIHGADNPSNTGPHEPAA